MEAALDSEDIAPLLGITSNAPVLRIERLTHDAGAAPIDFECLVYRGDTFRYRLTVDRNTREIESQIGAARREPV